MYALSIYNHHRRMSADGPSASAGVYSVKNTWAQGLFFSVTVSKLLPIQTTSLSSATSSDMHQHPSIAHHSTTALQSLRRPALVPARAHRQAPTRSLPRPNPTISETVQDPSALAHSQALIASHSNTFTVLHSLPAYIGTFVLQAKRTFYFGALSGGGASKFCMSFRL